MPCSRGSSPGPVFVEIPVDLLMTMVEDRLGITPFDLMDDAVKAAVEAAR